jgi:hypothetical protein
VGARDRGLTPQFKVKDYLYEKMMRENDEDEEIGYWFPFWGPFLLCSKVHPDLVKFLLNKSKQNRKSTLETEEENSSWGSLVRTYGFEFKNPSTWFNPKFSKYITLYLEAAKKYNPNSFRHIVGRNPELDVEGSEEHKIIWRLDKLWVNFQSKTEYFPSHTHGGDLQFCITLQIPREIQEEYLLNSNRVTSEGPGTTQWNYGEERLPFCIAQFAKLTERGDLMIWPSWVNHYVHAFQSDVQRITLCGEITLYAE